MSSINILGRVWFYDTGDSPEFELWEHEFEPTKPMRRSGVEWAKEHFNEGYDDKQLRELFSVPQEGNFQVLFKGTLEGYRCGPWEAPDSEWDEEFRVEESKYEPIPDDYLKFRLDKDVLT